jgi:hypothetical protein
MHIDRKTPIMQAKNLIALISQNTNQRFNTETLHSFVACIPRIFAHKQELRREISDC